MVLPGRTVRTNFFNGLSCVSTHQALLRFTTSSTSRRHAQLNRGRGRGNSIQRSVRIWFQNIAAQIVTNTGLQCARADDLSCPSTFLRKLSCERLIFSPSNECYVERGRFRLVFNKYWISLRTLWKWSVSLLFCVRASCCECPFGGQLLWHSSLFSSVPPLQMPVVHHRPFPRYASQFITLKYSSIYW